MFVLNIDSFSCFRLVQFLANKYVNKVGRNEIILLYAHVNYTNFMDNKIQKTFQCCKSDSKILRQVRSNCIVLSYT